MKYDVIGLGPDDLRLSAIYVAQTMANNVQNVKDAANRDVEKNPFTSANVDVLGQLKKNKFKIIQRNGKKIGVTTLLGNEHFAAVKQPRVDLKEAELALPPVIEAMTAAQCDLKVLVAFTTLENCRKIASQGLSQLRRTGHCRRRR